MTTQAFCTPKRLIEVLDYTFDWSEWLESDQIASFVFSIIPNASGDCTLAPSPPPTDGITATAWVSGGIAGTVYSLTCTVTTTGGRIGSRTGTLTVQN